MKVHELIERLQKCDQQADVGFVYETDDIMEDGFLVKSVIQTTFIVGDDEAKKTNFVSLLG